MGINLRNAAAYIHGQAPGKLDGLYWAVHEKCGELGLVPGRRDNIGGGDASAVGGNVRGILNFVAGVQPITDEERTPITVNEADKPVEGDSLVLLAEKENRRLTVPLREAQRIASLKAKQADHDALRKLYGTLQARFTSAGYKPKAAAGLT